MNNSRIKITQFNRKHPTAGSIEILFSTIRKFMNNNIDITVFIPKYKSQGLFKRLAIIGESYFNQGDVNHITGDIHFASFLLNKKKTILTIHDCVSVIHSQGLKQILLKFFWFTLPLKKVQYVTVISEKTKKELLSIVSFPDEKIFVIPDCISDGFYYTKQTCFNKTKPKILQIGTKTNKNLIRICEALQGIPCILDIVGKLSSEQIEALHKNKLEYKNSVNISEKALIQKYIDADIVAFVSTYEGFGMPILEAQTIGRALLTSNISPMLEVAGEDTCFVDPYSIEEIREGFLKIINDDNFRNNCIEHGLENVKKYNPSYVANMYVELYIKIFNNLKKEK